MTFFFFIITLERSAPDREKILQYSYLLPNRYKKRLEKGKGAGSLCHNEGKDAYFFSPLSIPLLLGGRGVLSGKKTTKCSIQGKKRERRFLFRGKTQKPKGGRLPPPPPSGAGGRRTAARLPQPTSVGKGGEYPEHPSLLKGRKKRRFAAPRGGGEIFCGRKVALFPLLREQGKKNQRPVRFSQAWGNYGLLLCEGGSKTLGDRRGLKKKKEGKKRKTAVRGAPKRALYPTV